MNMVWKRKPLKTVLQGRTRDPVEENGSQPTEIVNVLGKVESLLQEGNAEKALDVLARSRLKSPWVTNANGVCLLRLDRAEQAVNLFRGLALSPGGVVLRADAPLVFKTNFATALLACGNVGGCIRILHDINDEENRAVQQLRGAIEQLRKRLSLWTRLQWRMGVPPTCRVPLDFPPGNLE
jgi:hypothetical protein